MQLGITAEWEKQTNIRRNRHDDKYQEQYAYTIKPNLPQQWIQVSVPTMQKKL
jgi:hypothetical protein